MDDRPSGPLAGVRVADFTRVWAGPLATRLLADLGAEVIKLEAPGSRRTPPAVDEAGARAGNAASFGSFRKLNRNKLSIAVDLRQPEGRRLVRQLVAVSDVVVDNFSARVMPSFGLGAANLLALNPSIIVVAMPGFGSNGPYRDYVAYGQAIEPMTGLTSLMGYKDGGPMITGGAYPDPVAGVTAACAILTALVYRRHTGRGQRIDLSQLEATTSLLGEQILRRQLGGPVPRRLGNADPEWAPQGCYRCAGDDAWVAVSVRSEQQWRALCRLPGLEALDDDRFSTADGRREHGRALDAVLTRWTITRDKFTIMRSLQAAGVPAGAVSNAKELVEDPQLNATGFFVPIDDQPFGTIPYPGLPLRIGGERIAPARRAPALGQNDRYVTEDLLGMHAE